MANFTLVSLGVLGLLSGIISLGWVVSAMMQYQAPDNVKDWSKVGPVGPLAYYTSIGVTSLSLGMCFVSVALIILGTRR